MKNGRHRRGCLGSNSFLAKFRGGIEGKEWFSNSEPGRQRAQLIHFNDKTKAPKSARLNNIIASKNKLMPT